MHLSVFDKNVPFSLKYLNHTSVWEKQFKVARLPICSENLQKYWKLPTCLFTASLPTRTCRSRITMVRRVA